MQTAQSMHWVRALLLAPLISLSINAAAHFAVLPALFHAPDAWFYDLRTGLFSPRAQTFRDDLVLITIDDESLGDGYTSRSPVDRGLQATLVQALVSAGAKAIGLDFVYDLPGDPASDDTLISVLREAKNIPIVLGRLDARSKTYRFSGTRQEDFLSRTEQKAGHLYLGQDTAKLAIGDQVVRYWSRPVSTSSEVRGFAETLAASVGKPWQPKQELPELIAWQRAPKTAAIDEPYPFRILKIRRHKKDDSIAHLLWPGWEEVVKGKIVLVGGDFEDLDRHITPLSAVTRATVPGVVVHCQILAQILDNRRVRGSNEFFDFAITAFAAFLGMLCASRLRWRSRDSHVWLVGATAVLVIGTAAYSLFAIITPSGSYYLGWLAGVWTGTMPHVVRRYIPI